MDVREYTEVFPSALPARRESRWHAWVSVSVGCDNRCSFCIVPLVRGPQLSRSLGDVVAEVQGLARDGVVEVTLLGQNVNTYGRDLTVPGSGRRPLFAHLLRAVNDVEGIRRIRFMSPHPHDFTDDVIEAMAQCDGVCEHIHFPLQSGSDRVLRLMRRSYRAERYLRWLERIRAAIPGIAVTTDIIVGFPGETEQDFQDTLAVTAMARFDAAFTFQYSPRPGTPAAAADDQVPKAVVQERFDRLVALQEGISLEKNQTLVGRRLEVLIEGPGRKGGLSGRTRTNKLIHAEGVLEPGSFARVLAREAHPHHLLGELLQGGRGSDGTHAGAIDPTPVPA
jgi:tRNA-2-methylthio-N6-dimethylallyladenosine synthase